MRLKTVLKAGVVMLVVFFAVEWARTSLAPPRTGGPPLAELVFAEIPQQVSAEKPAFAFKGFQIRPLAKFTIRARVLSREDYYFGNDATLSPMDLALGWKRMADPAVYGALHITQGGRWYQYSWKEQPPIALQDIIESSANMHLIPADAAVEKTLKKASEGAFIRLSGHLVEATLPSGWRWTSSLTRSDSGANACELVFVESAELEN